MHTCHIYFYVSVFFHCLSATHFLCAMHQFIADMIWSNKPKQQMFKWKFIFTVYKYVGLFFIF